MAQLETAQPLHPESRAFLEALVKMKFKPFNELATIEEARASNRMAAKLGGEVTYDGTREEIIVPQPQVPEGIPIYVYKPNKLHSSDPAILVYFHGGGNVVGCRETADAICKILSSGAECIVVNVEYRLAPEHKFPAMIDDSCGVTKWVLENRTKVGGSKNSKVGVAGDSAGGQNAAAAAHEAPGLAFQILIYPHLSARDDRSLKSYKEYENGPVLDRPLCDWFVSLMCEPKDFANPRFANLLREKFDHLPPALFIVAECDPLRDDSYAYSKKLTDAGVHNELHLVKGGIHAFFTLPGLFPELSSAANAKAINFIKRYGVDGKPILGDTMNKKTSVAYSTDF